MAIDKIASVGGAGAAPSLQRTSERFAKVAADALQPQPGHGALAAPPREKGFPAQPTAAPGVTQAGCAPKVGPGAGVEASPGLTRAEASRVADRVLAAQQKLDKVLELAQSGKTFTTTELLALQAHVYSASQELDLAGKVVEKATSGLKTLLQTQL